MRKTLTMLIAAATIIALFAFQLSAAEKNSYKFGMWFGVGTEFDAQNKQIISDLVAAFSKKSKYNIEFVWFSDYNKFVDSVKKRELDFIYAFKYEVIYDLMMSGQYDPFLMPYLLGSKDFSMCLYVNAGSGIKSPADLKSKRILVAEGMPEYYVLRKILNDKPENVFGTIEKSVSGMSSMYSLAMNDTDAVYASEITEKFMKMNNPGPFKKISRLLCSEKYPFMPIMVSKSVPNELLIEFRNIFTTADKEEALKKYRPIFTTYKFKFMPVNRDLYKPVTDVFQEAKKKGWDRDHEIWKEAVKKRNK
ncbi:MAG: PhnD/SsuA/transferrin family substrate-binding protein [bacterium]